MFNCAHYELYAFLNAQTTTGAISFIRQNSVSCGDF